MRSCICCYLLGCLLGCSCCGSCACKPKIVKASMTGLLKFLVGAIIRVDSWTSGQHSRVHTGPHLLNLCELSQYNGAEKLERHLQTVSACRTDNIWQLPTPLESSHGTTEYILHSTTPIGKPLPRWAHIPCKRPAKKTFPTQGGLHFWPAHFSPGCLGLRAKGTIDGWKAFCT